MLEQMKNILLGAVKRSEISLSCGEAGSLSIDGEADSYKDGFPEKGRDGARFEIRPDGVWRIVTERGKDGELRERKPELICAPVEFVAVCRNQTGGARGLVIRFKDSEGRTHELTVLRQEMASQGSALTQRLAAEGLDVCAFGARGRVMAINSFLLSRPEEGLAKLRTVNGGGWTDETFSCFVFENETIRAKNGDIARLAEDAQAVTLKQKGTLKDWQTTVGEAAKYSARMRFAISTALAGTVLPIVGDMSRLFNFAGSSGAGKTTLLECAASVWGDRSFIRSWAGTKNAPEGMARKHNHLVMLMDELKQARPETLDAVGYLVANGKEQGRLKRNSNLKDGSDWSLYCLSTGEETFPQMKRRVMRGKSGRGGEVATGEVVRFIDIPIGEDDSGNASVFDSYPQDVAADALKRREWVQNTCKFPAYGTAGVAFLRALVKDVEQQGAARLKGELLTMVKEIEEGFSSKGLDDTQYRVLRAFAIVAITGEWAIKYGVLPWETGAAIEAAAICFNAWNGNEDTPQERANKFIEAVLSDPDKNERQYQKYAKDGRRIDRDAMPINGAYGKVIIVNHEAAEWAIVFDTAQFSELVNRCGEGLSDKEARKALGGAGVLYGTEQNKGNEWKYKTPTKSIFGLASRKWVTVVLRDVNAEVMKKIFKEVAANIGGKENEA